MKQIRQFLEENLSAVLTAGLIICLSWVLASVLVNNTALAGTELGTWVMILAFCALVVTLCLAIMRDWLDGK